MSTVVRVPTLNANEDEAVLVRWNAAAGAAVSAGDVLCTVETTKAAMDVEAEAAGFLHPVAKAGARLGAGAVLGALLDRADEDPAPLLAPAATTAAAAGARRWTKKAELAAARLQVDLEKLAAGAGGRVLQEADVVAASRGRHDERDLVDDRHPEARPQRVLLVGGAGGGGAITLDCLLRRTDQRPAGILDNNAATHGKRLMGVPVLGGNDRLAALWEAREFDAAIIVVTGSIDERARLFEQLRTLGIPAANVIDPSVTIRSHVSLGTGNLVMPGCFLSTAVRLGDNNFLAAGVMIEHHGVVGSHCTFGPRCTLSGAVTVGSRVKFGMGVLVEPYLAIGDEALVPSGVVVTQAVPARSVVRVQRGQAIRERE